MKPKRPTPPQGNDPLAVWVRAALLPWIESLELIGIIGGQKKTSAYGGYSLIINPAEGGASTPATIVPFRVQNHYEGYLVGRKLIGSEIGPMEPSQTYIARPYKLRAHPSWLIDGVSWSYSYNADFTIRIASASGQSSETQVIVPRYLKPYAGYDGDIIYAIKLPAPIATITPGGVSTPVEYMDTNCDGRAWAKENG